MNDGIETFDPNQIAQLDQPDSDESEIDIVADGGQNVDSDDEDEIEIKAS